MCNNLFTCELIQTAALAATMQGHAGLQDPAKGQKGEARKVSALHQLKTPLTGVCTSQQIFGANSLTGLPAQLKPANQLSSVQTPPPG